jgi:hypothetical protein
MKRPELAVWDMDSVWDDFDKAESPIVLIEYNRSPAFACPSL